MPIIINQIRAPLLYSHESIVQKALKSLNINSSLVLQADIHKISLDARKREDIHYVCSVYVRLSGEHLERRLCEKYKAVTYVAPSSFEPVLSGKKADGRVIVTGFGPAGMFCALALAEQGYKPIVLERGESIQKRIISVSSFWKSARLNESSNVQFGEGGAGTFSDGKLTTRINDPLCGYVLQRLVEFGAPKEICTKAKPHIGTDNLRSIVQAIRQRIISLGGEVRFETKLEGLIVKDGCVTGVKTSVCEEKASAVVLALGHSARDTFEMLAQSGIVMQPKAFSVGARIEHLQTDVDKSLYGKYALDPALPKGEYQLSYRENGCGVYTFCMCPGGSVVAAASEYGGVVTNGMSEFARDGQNANAALVVSVTPDDFGSGVLDGVEFARMIEQNAYKLTGSYKAAGTTVRGFLNGRPDLETDLVPTYPLGLTECDYTKIFPKKVTDMMALGLQKFSKKMACFGNHNAILSAPETRTSSPVRITRTIDFNAVGVSNLYPCGEGAGYAGGIMSAAVDGLRVALKIMSIILP